MRATPAVCLCLATLVLGVSAVASHAAPPTPDPAAPDASAPSSDDTPNPLEAPRIGTTIASLEERSRLLVELIADAARGYRAAALERAATEQELVAAQERLDREAVRSRDATVDRLDVLTKDVLSARSRYGGLCAVSDQRLADLRRLLAERDVLGRRLAELRARQPHAAEPLTGVWEVTFLPGGTTATFYLDQAGTLVTGQYRMGSAGSGSLQGTFVNGKLFMQRIDAEKGRDAEIEGLLDPDAGRIRGTWQAYELVQGGLPRGQWVARRVK